MCKNKINQTHKQTNKYINNVRNVRNKLAVNRSQFKIIKKIIYDLCSNNDAILFYNNNAKYINI